MCTVSCTLKLMCNRLSGLMFHECSTNSAPLFTGVCRTKHLNIWWTAALLSQTLLVVNICDQPVATSRSCHNTDVRCSAIGPSLLLVCQPGTRCQTVYTLQDPARFVDCFWRDLKTSFLRLLAYIVCQRLALHKFTTDINIRLLVNYYMHNVK